MSFWTDFTPLTELATLTADLMSSRELTKPLSWTTPLNVSSEARAESLDEMHRMKLHMDAQEVVEI